jgi:hypothetical protein
VVVLVGVVAEDGDRLAERGPDVVEVHAGGHHAHDDLERAGLRDLDLLDLEGVQRLALALAPDDPGGHRAGQLAGLGVDGGDLREVNGHGSEPYPPGRRSSPVRRKQAEGDEHGARSYPPITSRRKSRSVSMWRTSQPKFMPKKPVTSVSGRKIVAMSVIRVARSLRRLEDVAR